MLEPISGATILAGTVAVTGTAAIKKAADLVISDLYSFAKTKWNEQATEAAIRASTAKLLSSVNKLKKVKTLATFHKPVDLYSFYCPSNILYDGNRYLIDSVQDFPFQGGAVIQGIAGQGKSIFLRHLCCYAVYSATAVPVFVELRRANENNPIWKLGAQFLKSIGFTVTEEAFYEMLVKQKISLFLDGYDEVDDANRDSVTAEIEYLSSMNEASRILITSRPDTGIEFCQSLTVVQLAPLVNDDYIDILKKLTKNNRLTKVIVQSVDAHSGNVKGFLTTPLMVSMLAITYEAFQKLPDTMAEFYDLVFDVLLQRHDGTKFGFNRRRKSQLNDSLFRKVFEEVCFETLKNSNSGLVTKTLLFACVGGVLRRHDKEHELDNYITDVTSVTCLILKDGTGYRFVHKSIQEYYAASHVKHRSDDNAQKFYRKLSAYNSPQVNTWRQVLRFLNEIDTVRFSRFYQIPRAREVFKKVELDPDSELRVSPKITIGLLGELELAIGVQPGEKSTLLYLMRPSLNIESYWPIFTVDYANLAKAELEQAGGRITKNDTFAGEWEEMGSDRSVIIVSINQLVSQGILERELSGACFDILTDFRRLYQEAEKILVQEDAYEMDDF